MCTRAYPYGRVGRCGFGGQGVTNGIRADPRGCAYGSVCGYRAHDACGPEMGHTAWHMGALDVRSCAKREGSWTFARVSVRTYACACGPGMGHTTWRMGRPWVGELDRRGRQVL
jgi:hypothetical protein